ncbi:MAG: hypothetical protein ACE5JS_16000 [Nitrospinota bacterium]
MSDDREQAIADVRHWVASQAETFNEWRELPEFLRPFKQDIERAGEAYNRLEHMSRHAGHGRLFRLSSSATWPLLGRLTSAWREYGSSGRWDSTA